MGGKELAAHQQSRPVLKSQQRSRPAGRGRWNQGELVTSGQLTAHLVLHHIDGRQRWTRLVSTIGAGGGGGTLVPEVPQESGTGIGSHQHQSWPAAGQQAQNSNAIGVDITNHHL